MTVIVYKMINGEEIIGEKFEHLADLFVIKSPAQIVIQRTEKVMGVALAPYMPYASEEKIRIFKHAIASECVPDQNMVNEYNRVFGSGIQVVTASAIATL